MFIYCIFVVPQATRQQSLTYGCIVENKETHEVSQFDNENVNPFTAGRSDQKM